MEPVKSWPKYFFLITALKTVNNLTVGILCQDFNSLRTAYKPPEEPPINRRKNGFLDAINDLNLIRVSVKISVCSETLGAV